MIKSSQIKNYIHNNKNNPYSKIHEVRTYGLYSLKLTTLRCGRGKPPHPRFANKIKAWHDMAIFHLSTKIIKRSDGRSSVGASAYRSASKMIDNRTGKSFNYTKKR